MNNKRYEELKRKSEKYGEITRNEYLEIMSYERPEYYQKLMNVYNNWDTMDENEFERIMNELDPQDRGIIDELIDPDY